MKKYTILIQILHSLSLMCIIQSCDNDNIYYSCDVEIDKWVKNNMEEVSVMTRSESIQTGDLPFQKALYNAFTPEQKSKLWVEKFECILTLLPANEAQCHVRLLMETVLANPQWFGDNMTDSEREKFDIFSYKWVEYAKSQLGFSDRKLYALIGSPENVVVTRSGDIIVETLVNKSRNVKKRTEDGEGYGNVCDCGDGSDYLQCSGFDGYECKVNYNDFCRQTEKECGIFLLNACWGNCKKGF